MDISEIRAASDAAESRGHTQMAKIMRAAAVEIERSRKLCVETQKQSNMRRRDYVWRGFKFTLVPTATFWLGYYAAKLQWF